MKTIEKKTEVQHQWPIMEEYYPEGTSIELSTNNINEDIINTIKKIPVNKYIHLKSDGTVGDYTLIIGQLQKAGLDVGKGNCEYGWRMPIKNKKRELRIFRRY